MNILRNFVALIKGMPDWHEKYNQDMSYLYDEVNGAKSDGIINTYVHSKSGTNHTLTGAGAIMRFTARAPWIAGDTVTVNGTRLNPLNLEGTPLPAGAFVAGMQVVAIQDGQNLQFLTQSYADTFANINSQMENKANKNAPVEYNLQFVEGFVDRGLVEGEHTSKYCRDLFGRVHIKMSFQSDPLENVIMGKTPFVTMMPEGFRPREITVAAAYGCPNNSVGGIATIIARINGEIAVYGASPYSHVHGQITYLAK